VAIAVRDPNICVVDLDGNVGEAAALSAGFNTARGPVVVTLDGDGRR
jgi:glycosyltransferase involved in cell wall biosynthesis